MTVPATSRRAGPYNGNGSANTFTFTFKTFSASDLQVIKTSSLGTETVLVLDSHYSVALNVDQDVTAGGTVTYPINGTKLATGEKLTILSLLDLDQTTDLLGGGAFNARVIEDTFDRTVIQIQQLDEELDRALKVPASSSINANLPEPLAGYAIGWNSSADGLTNLDTSTLVTSVAYANSVTDLFNGNGSSTEFALSVNPGQLDNLLVAIDGVVQRPGADYTWVSGTTLTFTSAPPAGTDNVMVRYAQAVPAGTIGAQDWGSII